MFFKVYHLVTDNCEKSSHHSSNNCKKFSNVSKKFACLYFIFIIASIFLCYTHKNLKINF